MNTPTSDEWSALADLFLAHADPDVEWASEIRRDWSRDFVAEVLAAGWRPVVDATDEAAVERVARELWRQDYGIGTVWPGAGRRHDLYVNKAHATLRAAGGAQ